MKSPLILLSIGLGATLFLFWTQLQFNNEIQPLAINAQCPNISHQALNSTLYTLLSTPRYSTAQKQTFLNEFEKQLFSSRWIVDEWRYDRGVNVFARHMLAGPDRPDRPILMISAHYDTVGDDIVGIRDNGASVAVLLEIARVLDRQYSWSGDLDIWLVSWDTEESWFKGMGSWEWMKSADGQKIKNRIVGLINMDSIGKFTSEPHTQQFPKFFGFLLPFVYWNVQKNENRGDFLAAIADRRSSFLTNSLVRGYKNCQPQSNQLPIMPMNIWLAGRTRICQNKYLRDLCRSDHWSFWDSNVAAVHLTDTANFRSPCYHRQCDVVSNLTRSDMNGIIETARYVAAGILQFKL